MHALATDAQTFDEWFRQKATQEKYLAQQIAALQQYAAVARRGYQVVQQGLNMIDRLKDGEFTLHSIFYAGFAIVNCQIFYYVQAHPPVSTGAKP
jgi:hypothetical protein